MSYTKIRIERATLYDEVWSDPVVDVAKRYNMSNVGLKKICRKLAVPVPPLGYWRKVETGRTPARIPLPRYSGPDFLERIRHIDDSPPPPPPPPTPKEVIAQQAFESRPENRIAVPDDLHGCHALVTNTNRGFKTPFADARGVTWPRGDAVLSISVCEPNQRRALFIADAILKAAEARGWPVLVTKEHPRQTLITVDGEASAFRLTEKTKRSDRPLTPEEQRKKRYEKSWRPPNPWTYAPTGEFTLHLLPEKSTYPFKLLSDRKGKPLEMQLNEVMVALVAESVNRKEAREAARLHQIEADKAAAVRWKRQERERHEAKEIEALEKEVSQWERAERIRTYARAVQVRLCNNGKDPSTELRAWLEWANKKADYLDPLCDTPDSEPEGKLSDDVIAQIFDEI